MTQVDALYVVDSSVVAKWILPEGDSVQAKRLIAQVVLKGERLIVSTNGYMYCLKPCFSKRPTWKTVGGRPQAQAQCTTTRPRSAGVALAWSRLRPDQFDTSVRASGPDLPAGRDGRRPPPDRPAVTRGAPVR